MKNNLRIRIKREWHMAPDTFEEHVDHLRGVIFTGTRRECLDKIDQLEEGVYYLSHNESCRPTYSIKYRS